MSQTMKRLHAEDKLHRNVQGLALKLYGRCQANARSTGSRCGNAALPQTKYCRMHSQGRKKNRTKKKNTTHYYRKAVRRDLYEEMKANRVDIPRRIAELESNDKRTLAQLTGPYINAIRDHHDDGEGLMEYLEQLIVIEAIDFLSGSVTSLQYHRRAAGLCEGRHKLPIRLSGGDYGSDDEYTLKKGTKVGVSNDLGTGVAAARKVYKKVKPVKSQTNNVTLEDFGLTKEYLE